MRTSALPPSAAIRERYPGYYWGGIPRNSRRSPRPAAKRPCLPPRRQAGHAACAPHRQTPAADSFAACFPQPPGHRNPDIQEPERQACFASFRATSSPTWPSSLNQSRLEGRVYAVYPAFSSKTTPWPTLPHTAGIRRGLTGIAENRGK